MDYMVIIHKAEEGGFWAEFPALAGCFTQGETVEEILENSREAAESHLAALKSENMKITAEEDIIVAKIHIAS